MAKLKAPLMSLGASGKLGDAVVYLPWKGLNNVREYVIPANPRTAGQVTQRGYLTDIVARIHSAQAAANPLDAEDISAYALWASVVKSATTWFNQACKNFMDQKVAGLDGGLYASGKTTPGASKLDVEIYAATTPWATAGTFYYGTSKTALVNTKAATVAAAKFTASLTGLTTGVKYFWQFRPTAPAGNVGQRSGIYYGVAA